jgi:glycosyltransferase involved in cell wall biosynthesis
MINDEPNGPLVSMIMSVRNGADTIKETLESVIAQTYQNWEFLIRDNCSTDGTADIIKSFNDPRIQFFQNSADKGAWYNFILLIEISRGEYIKQLDDDSYLYPSCLEKQVDILLTKNDIAMVTSDTEYHKKNGTIIPAKIPLKNDVITRDDYIKFALLTARGSIQEGNQILVRMSAFKFYLDRIMAIGMSAGLINMYSPYFYLPSAVLTKGNMYIIRQTLSAGRIEANSYSLKFNQAKLQPAWIRLIKIDGYRINPFLYIWGRIIIFIRSTARWLAFKIIGRD